MGENPTNGELIDELSGLTKLSEREAEVMVHMADEIESADSEAAARRAVARGLGIEPSTVDTHYRRALEKLHESMRLMDYAESDIAPAVPDNATND